MGFRFLVSFFILSLVAAQVSAQNWEDNGAEIEDAKVIIEKDRKIELPSANRSYEKVPPLPVPENDEVLQYDFKDYSLILQPLDPKIRVLTIQDEKLNKFYGNYIKAGFGNYVTPYLEGFFNNKRNDRYAIGAHIKHLSSKNGPVDEENSGFSENIIDLYGKLFTKPLTFTGDIKYQRNKNYFYGYAPELEVDEDSIKQIYNNFYASIGLVSNSSNPDLFYKLNASFNYLSDHYISSELQTGFNLKMRYTLSELLELNIKSDLYLTKIENAGTTNRNFFRITPTFKTTFEPLEITGGINIVYENDSIFNGNQIHFYPTAQATYHITDAVKVYGGIDGDMNRTSLQYFVNENPFIASNIPVLNTNKTMALYGALEGKAFKMLSFKGGFSIANYKNMYYYVNSKMDSSKFDVIYENDNTSLLNLFAELGISKSEVFNLVLRTDLYHYGTDTLKKAWHKPEFGVSLLGSYNLYDKILFSAQLAALGGIEGKNLQSGTEKSLDAIVDLGLEVEYLFSERASLFLDFNNILNNNNERYLNYPSRKFLFMAGLTYSF